MTITRLDSSYIAELLYLENNCFSHPLTKEQLTGSLEGGIFLGAFEKGRLCGYIGFFIASDCCEILNLCVLPEMQRKGFGNILLKEVENTAKNNNCSGIFLELRKSNIKAYSLYEKNGFVFDCIRKNYYSNPTEDAVLMHKNIKGNYQ